MILPLAYPPTYYGLRKNTRRKNCSVLTLFHDGLIVYKIYEAKFESVDKNAIDCLF
jgi:hypothetical protein